MKKSNHFCFRLVAIKLVILLASSLPNYACKANYKQGHEPAWKEIAMKELGNDFTTTFNESKTYVLCQQKRVGEHVDRKIKYIIINISNIEIVRSGSFQSGYVKWNSDYSIELATSEKFSSELTKTIIPVKSNLN